MKWQGYAATTILMASLQAMALDSLTKSKVNVPPIMTDKQDINSMKEDRIAESIWNKYVDGDGKSTCTSLRKMVDAYAYRETTVWDMDKDVQNPEWPQWWCEPDAFVNSYRPEDCSAKGNANQGGLSSSTCCPGDVDPIPANREAVRSYNDLLKLNRHKLGRISSGASCPRVLDMLGCPVPLVRNAAIWEFVFRRPNREWDTAANRDNLFDSDVVKAYNSVRCRPILDEQGHPLKMPCDKETKTAAQGLSPMFRFKKGRGTSLDLGAPGAGQRLLTLAGGIAYPNRGIDPSFHRAIDEQGSIANFWDQNVAGQHGEGQPLDLRQCDKELHRRFCTTASEADCKWWQEYCEVMNEEQMEMNHVTKEIWSPAPVVDPANLGQVDEVGHVIYNFRKCGVPWVGGVSGSVLEFFGMLEKHMKSAIDDLLVLQWMAYYELRGFHSMGEIWIALHPFLKALGYSADGQGANRVKIGLLSVDPPMTTDGCVSGNEGSESEFLDKLEAFVNGYTTPGNNLLDHFSGAGEQAALKARMSMTAHMAAAEEAKDAARRGRVGVVEEVDPDDVEALLRELGH